MSSHPPHDPDARFFSYDEANRTLPLVRRIVEDILAQFREVRPRLALFNGMTGGERDSRRGRDLKTELDRRGEAIQELVDELQELGCLFKGFDDGLVDWHSLYAGRPVFLCWKLGEPEIAWWHQVDAGFNGRQPILPDQRPAFRGR